MSDEEGVIEISQNVAVETDTPSKSVVLVAALAASLSACGGGSSTDPVVTTVIPGKPVPPTVPVIVVPSETYPKAESDQAASRFLQHCQLAATQAQIAALRSTTYAAYLKQQFETPLGQTGWNWLEQQGYGAVDANNYFFNSYPADFMLWNQLFTAPDSMRKRCALALSEYFVVSTNAIDSTWQSHMIAQYWDTLVEGAFGNFRHLLESITLNPAMGYYLNTRGNQKEDASKGRLPDENYSREVMQLFTIGLHALNLDGTEKRDSTGKRVETYVPSDVAGLAKVFTGYDFDTSDGVRHTPPGFTYTIVSKTFTTKRMSLNVANHSTSSTAFLGTAIPANTTAAAALKIALDTLFNHPNAAPFFCKQMIQRLVTSDPSPAYVERVSSKFVDNGQGVRGDLKAVWAAILQDDEALSEQGLTRSTFGKLREPMLRFIQWGRTFAVTSTANSWKVFDLSNTVAQLGQSPLRSPSVFNFFRPGFVPPNTVLASTLSPAPEFQLVNEVTVGGYLNFMQDTIRNGILCPEPKVPQAAYTNYLRDVLPDYTKELTLVLDPTALVAHLNVLLCAGQLSIATQAIIVTALNGTVLTATSTTSQKLDRVSAAVLLVMASSEYLIQK